MAEAISRDGRTWLYEALQGAIDRAHAEMPALREFFATWPGVEVEMRCVAVDGSVYLLRVIVDRTDVPETVHG